jgi:nitroreductase
VDAYQAIVSKRDSRSFTDEPISEEALRRVLQAGRMAGSAKNLQPCRFVVIDDADTAEKLAGCGQFSSWIPTAPVNIAVVIPADGRDFDAGRAAQNIMVAANAEGLASCPVTMHDNTCACEVLGIPDGHRVVIVVAVGYPGAGPRSRGAVGARLPFDDYVHRGRWSSASNA